MKIKFNKKKIKIVIVVAILIIIGLIAAILLINYSYKKAENDMIKSFEKMGSDFYENLYYVHSSVDKNEEELEKYFSKFNTGIMINLETIKRFDNSKYKKEIEDNFKNPKTKKACDENKTIVIVTPNKPYGKKDYSTEAVLECGFNKK